MPWFAVHTIEYIECIDWEQETFDVYENVLLIEASDEQGACDKAVQIATIPEDAGHCGLVAFGRPARQVFGGIRKVIWCENAEERPGDGTEITYSGLSVKGREGLRALLADDTVDVVYQSSGPDEYPDIAQVP